MVEIRNPNFWSKSLRWFCYSRWRNLLLGSGEKKMMNDVNVGMGKDHTLFALKDGKVKFRYDKLKKKQFVSVV